MYEWWFGSRALLDEVGIERWEVMEVLFSPRRWSRPATSREGLAVLTVWGRTDEGRALLVLLRWLRVVGRWQILFAAPMTSMQLAEYTAWEVTGDE